MNIQIEIGKCDFCDNKAESVRITMIDEIFRKRLLYAQLCREHRLLRNEEFKRKILE